MLDFFSKKAKGGDSSNDNSEGPTEPTQGPTPAILLEEATGIEGVRDCSEMQNSACKI
jgi:hypothetical protein